MKVCHIFTLTVGIKAPFREFEGIHWHIFTPKFHENPGRLDSIFNSAEPLSLKLSNSPKVISYFHEILEERPHRVYLQTNRRDV